MSALTGYHAIEAALARWGNRCGTLLVGRRSPRIESLVRLAEENGVPVRQVAMEELDRYAGRDEHRGVVLLAEQTLAGPVGLRELAAQAGDTALFILLDGVTDPRNLGAVVRSADLFEADAVVITRRRSAHQTRAVHTASAGATQWVPLVEVANLAQAIASLKKAGFWVYGAEAGARDPASVDLAGRVAIVLGSEGSGLRRLVRESCDGLLGIPSGGHVGSFNVSVAAAILMYETRRQQRAKAAAGTQKPPPGSRLAHS